MGQGRGASGQTLMLSMLLVCLSSVVYLQGEAEAMKRRVDRHHTCAGCHRLSASLISDANPFPEGIDRSSLCMDCHHYQENHHPVNFAPEGAGAPAEFNSFPLFEGEVRCLTCHEVHADTGPKLLRGGPYGYRTEICFRCHDRDMNTKVNPHAMLDESGSVRNVGDEPVCLLCHKKVPERSVVGGNATFKADVAFLCWRCHPPMAGEFFRNHFLVKPQKTTLGRMKKAETESGVAFPLLNRDRITCSTCHNPHQQGVVITGAAKAGADEHDRLRLPREVICSGCHIQ